MCDLDGMRPLTVARFPGEAGVGVKRLIEVGWVVCLEPAGRVCLAGIDRRGLRSHLYARIALEPEPSGELAVAEGGALGGVEVRLVPIGFGQALVVGALIGLGQEAVVLNLFAVVYYVRRIRAAKSSAVVGLPKLPVFRLGIIAVRVHAPTRIVGGVGDLLRGRRAGVLLGVSTKDERARLKAGVGGRIKDVLGTITDGVHPDVGLVFTCVALGSQFIVFRASTGEAVAFKPLVAGTRKPTLGVGAGGVRVAEVSIGGTFIDVRAGVPITRPPVVAGACVAAAYVGACGVVIAWRGRREDLQVIQGPNGVRRLVFVEKGREMHHEKPGRGLR